MKNKGTALLVTVLLIGAIGAIAFGVFKIANSELYVGTKQEEGTEAFYAAQAGVEDALMRFKFADGGRLEVPTGAREDTTKVDRIDIKKGIISPSGQDYGTNPDPGADNYIYDLKAWYKTENEFKITLEKDQSVILDLTDVVDKNESLIVKWEPKGPTPEIMESAKLWYRLYDPDGRAIDPRDLEREFFTYLAYFDEDNENPARTDSKFDSFILKPNVKKRLDTLGFNTIKFKAFGNDSSKIILTVKATGGAAIGGPNLYIESTGYHGDTARKLKVTVDRASKSVLDIFDYVIYSGNKPLP